MQLFLALQPRDHVHAGRTASVLAVVGAAIPASSCWVPTPAVPTEAGAVIVTLLGCIVIVIIAGLTTRMHKRHRVLWAALPFVAILLIVGLDLATSDASVRGQVFLFFPTLYATSQLRPPGAIAVMVAAVAGDMVIVFAFLSLEEALIDIAYVGAALITTGVLLMLSGQRQEELVTLLERQAAVDPLTGLATRRVLDQAARSALTGANSGQGTALILIDVDDFKLVNDRYGHPGGDAVLVQLAQLFTRLSRSGDIVSRIGGDEIALLLPGCSIERAMGRAARILSDVEKFRAVTDDGAHISVTVTAGLAHSPTHAHDLRGLYAVADEALYTAKRSGKGRVGEPVAH